MLASPEAAASSWVGDEVAWWRRYDMVDDAVRRLIVVRTDGTLAWHEADVDWAATTCLPTALRGGFRQAQTWAELPRPPGRPYVDLLPAAMGGSLRRGSIGPMDRQAAAVLLDAVADVAATVRGLPKEEMVGEHRRQARRTGATVVATVAVVLALVAGLFVDNHRPTTGATQA